MYKSRLKRSERDTLRGSLSTSAFQKYIARAVEKHKRVLEIKCKTLNFDKRGGGATAGKERERRGILAFTVWSRVWVGTKIFNRKSSRKMS